ncbi:MAG: ATP-binding protein [Deltaproteobacteria bacterium]|nr:ATP-binding protein [Deltaproteobacteria bacterium]
MTVQPNDAAPEPGPPDHEAAATCSIRLPADRIYLPPAKAFLSALAPALGFSHHEMSGLETAMEEAFINVIEHGYGGGPGEPLSITFTITPTDLTITFHEKGIPFDPGRLAQCPQPSMDADCFPPGFGLSRIQSAVDHMEFVHLGRAGKELRLVKRRHPVPGDSLAAHGTAGPDSGQADDAPPMPSQPYVVRALRPDEAAEISRLAWRTYGLTHADFVYQPEQLAGMIREGRLTSFAAVTSSGEVVGHVALEVSPNSPAVVLLGLGFVHPQYRRSGVFRAVNEKTMAEAGRMGFMGAYLYATAGHPFSQKVALDFGFTPCCIMLGARAADTDFKGLIAPLNQRESVITHYLAFKPQKRYISMPSRHAAMIRRIYDWIGLPVEGKSEEPPACPLPEIFLKTSYDKAFNIIIIQVMSICAEAEIHLRSASRKALQKKVDIIYVLLNLEDADLNDTVEFLESQGFFFAGIQPYGLMNKDALVMQYLNLENFNWDKIKVASPVGQELFGYIKDEKKRLHGE